jgi:ABC-type uncharacterized transport system ATPase subunit
VSANLLEAHGVSRRFGRLAALDGLNFSVREGEMRCIIGPNGAGKTTFLNVLSGLIRPSEGRIMFEGHDIARLSPLAIAHRGILRSFQTPGVLSGLSVETNMEIGARRPGRPREGAGERIAHLLEEFGLAPRRKMHAGDLSHGDKKRLELAMLLAGAPRMLLLDEPTAGMSIRETDEIVELLKRLCAGMTVVVIEHDMSFVRQIAERVSVFHRGALLAEGLVDEIKADERVQSIYLGSGVD